MKIYELIKTLLTDNPVLRDSDKRLIWEVWDKLGLTDSYVTISKLKFMEAPSTETIRRCRQKIQELHPELRSSKDIQEVKDKIADQRGTFIYRENIEKREDLSAPVNVMMRLKEDFIKRGL